MKHIFLTSGFCFLAFDSNAFASSTVVKKEPAQSVSAAQFRSAQRVLFTKADINFDGRVTRDEISQARWKRNLPRHKKAFAKLDANNNGFLDYNEIEANQTVVTEKLVQRNASTKTSLLKKYDTDGNGTISENEIDDYLEKQVEKTRSKIPEKARKRFERRDKDSSGLITLEEYIPRKPSPQIVQNRQVIQVSNFSRDVNRDGIITRLENETFTTEALEALDKNDDGEISPQEQTNRGYRPTQSISLRTVYFRAPRAKTVTSNR